MNRYGTTAFVATTLLVASHSAKAQSPEAEPTCKAYTHVPARKGALADEIAACSVAVKRQLVRADHEYYLAYNLRRAERYVEALPIFRKLAEADDPRAQSELGLMLKDGVGISKDMIAAFQLFQKSANRDHIDGQFNLAILYAEKENSLYNLEKAAYWMRKAASKGNPDAHYRMFVIKSRGLGEARDDTEASSWLDKAVLLGQAEAQYEKAEMSSFDWLRYPTKLNEGLRLMNLAAEQGYVPAQIKLAVMYEHGVKVPTDKQIALNWYRKAAAQGNEAAANRLSAIASQTVADRERASVTSGGQRNSASNESSTNWIFWIIGGLIVLRLLGGSSRKSTSQSNKGSDWQMPKQTSRWPCPTCGGTGYTWQTWGSQRYNRSTCIRCHGDCYIES